MTGTSTRMISSVAYAVEERASDEKTARAVGLPSRSCSSWSVASEGPSTLRLNRYDVDSGRSIGEVTGNARGAVDGETLVPPTCGAALSGGGSCVSVTADSEHAGAS